MRIGLEAARRGCRLEAFATLGSTNDEAMARARQGDPGRLWIVAEEQTQGRGRQARPWASPKGNLHASLLLVDACAPRAAPQLGFVAGVALVDALQAAAPGVAFALKWPNDVLRDGAKLAGVLAEGAMLKGGGFACVVGFGVDCLWSPDDLPYPATNLAACGAAVAPADLLPALSDAMARRLDLWRGGAGFADIRRAWLGRAGGLGAPLRVQTGRDRFEGVFETIDDDGRLILATPAGRRSVEAADVFPATHGVAPDPERTPS
ncbi:MAG TPA: biotin--[acetyl-CoA-carboxylase] ligase [Beijerinckiaceae bacterium]